MSLRDDYHDKRQIRPLMSLAFVVVLSLLMTGLSFTIFWNSNARDIVQSLQRIGDSSVPSPEIASEGINNDGKLTTAELRFIKTGLDAEFSKLTPETDFNGSPLSKTNIGF